MHFIELCTFCYNDILYRFRIGITTGFVGSRIFMSVVASTVNAVIVCFAEDPQQLAQNYPQLSRDMNEAWEVFKPVVDDEKCEV